MTTYEIISRRFCRRLYVPETSDVQVCPIYGNTVLALRTNDSVVLYASRSEDKHCKYEKLEVIESRELANFVCFESGYIEYLAIAGRETHLFHFFEDEFQDNIEKDLLHDGKSRRKLRSEKCSKTFRFVSQGLPRCRGSRQCR